MNTHSTIYNPIIIDYEEEDEEFSLDEENINQKFHYKGQSTMPLKEIGVDPGYELEMVHPFELELLKKLRERFLTRKKEPIPFYDLTAAIYQIGNDMDKKITKFHIIHHLRNLWRAGLIVRLVRGRTSKTKKIGRGEWHGIHYILYSKEELKESE